MMGRIAIALALSVLAGCVAKQAGIGNTFTQEQVHALKIGMTEEEVVKIMGSQPVGREVSTKDGRTREELGWVDMGVFSYRSVGAVFVDGELAEIKRTTGP